MLIVSCGYLFVYVFGIKFLVRYVARSNNFIYGVVAYTFLSELYSWFCDFVCCIGYILAAVILIAYLTIYGIDYSFSNIHNFRPLDWYLPLLACLCYRFFMGNCDSLQPIEDHTYCLSAQSCTNICIWHSTPAHWFIWWISYFCDRHHICSHPILYACWVANGNRTTQILTFYGCFSTVSS